MKSKQKRLLIFSMLFTVLLVLSTARVFAAEDAIPSVTVDAVLNNDGSAVITEIWEVRGVSSGTEYYKALNNMDGMNVHSLLVWDESGMQYKTLNNWEINLSREEKAGTCGILKKSDGYELCWGIGSYGDHKYTIQYVLEGLVKDYGDYAGFYHQFISELSSAPERISIKIRMEDTNLTADNARIWGYGFTGEVEIGNDGSLNAFSTDALDGSDYVNVLCRFDRSLFPLASDADMAFEKLQQSAENENSNAALYVVLAVLAAVIILAAFLVAFFSSRYKLADGTAVRLPPRREIRPEWAVPFNGSIPAVYFAMKLLRRVITYEKLMSAYLIRWQQAGYIRIEEREKEGNIKKPKKEEAIVFNPEKKPDKGTEQTLYKILTIGTGGEGILRTSDMEKRAEELYGKLTAWSEEVENDGKELLIRSGAAEDTKGVIRFTASGFDEAVKILGFQKYLMEMKEENENSIHQRELWGDYLVFAALLGLGEQVLKNMEVLDPAYFNTFAGTYGYSAYSMIHFMTMTNHISNASTPNTSGTGGSASSVGGGGFSGGGGGGSR
ncbi:hypothetical protein OXPF_36430 [Oxobacter pfennigii]|uniref:DUF2207 domain-containing protein n=1 Tax=Oxobacter pfennigii TaxID=36849 RepID=A0A0P8WX39_9CLOT|nr:DUF2207 domain-containing protein [Oxobacter pfennigii]KPU42875.1 hypothetical protein OXPF_36430 [Oxobacter pfennigii]